MSIRVIAILALSSIILRILARRRLTIELNKLFEYADKSH